MSLPTNLFIDTPEMHDVSLTQLSNDIESWPEEIVLKLKETVPDSAGLSVMVKFMKKDEENGVATGSITVTSPEKKAIIPIIIKDFKLFPLDVILAENKHLPLTPEIFKAIFSSNDVFANLEEYPTYSGSGHFDEGSLWNAVYPPNVGRYSYANGQYPMLEHIATTIDGKSIPEMDEKTAAMFERNGHSEILKKLANLQPVNMNEFRKGVDKLIPKNVLMLRAETPNKYSLLSSSDKMFHPGIKIIEKRDLVNKMSAIGANVDDLMNEVDQNGEKLLRVPEPKNEVILAEEEQEYPEIADSFGHYMVKGRTGVNFEGIVLPKVIDFDQNLVGLKLFIGKTMSSIQKDFAGIRLENSRYQLEDQYPKVGQTGVFVYQPDKNNAIATVPVTIQSVVEYGGQEKIKAMTLMGAPLRIKTKDPLIKRIVKTQGGYLLPKRMKWVAMEGFEPLTDSPESYSVKTAGQRLTGTPVLVMPTGYGQFAVRGLNKYAQAAGWDASNLQGYQVQFLLASLGAGREKIAKSMELCKTRGQASIHGLNFIPTYNEKVASQLPKAREVLAKTASIRADLFKEASYMESSQTVDALLSLNFINPENITKFISKIPLFKSTISQLANCLIASRLGINEIPEMATSSAIKKILEVVQGLESLKSTQEVGVQ